MAVFERKTEFGVPVRCGCGFSDNCFEPLGLPLKKEWIIERIHGVSLRTPSLYTYYNENTKGYIIEKAELIRHLVKKAGRSGVSFHPGEGITGVEKGRSGYYEIRSEKGTYSSKVLVDCSGFTSPVRRFLGLGKIPTVGAVRYLFRRGKFDIERLGIVRAPEKRYVNFIFHPGFFPNGYGWAFPMGDTVQVGAACIGDPVRSLENYLSHLGAKRPRPRNVIGGRIPYQGPEGKLVYGRVMLMGESASLVNPMNLAGNYGGMLSASMGAEAVTQYFNRNEKNKGKALGALGEYERMVLGHPSQSPKLKKGARALYSLSEKALDMLGKCSNREGEGGLSVRKLILRLLITPSLYREAGRLLTINRAMPSLWESGW